MREGSKLFRLLLIQRYYSEFELLANQTRLLSLNVSYPRQNINTIFEYKARYRKTLKDHAYSRTPPSDEVMVELSREPHEFHQQKTDFLTYLARYLSGRDFGNTTLYQIGLSARNLLERDTYIGTPVLIDTDPESISSRTQHVLEGFDDRSHDGLLAFLITSVHATAKALANDNKLKSNYILTQKEVHQIMDRLAVIDLSWLNRMLSRRILYRVSLRGQNEVPLRFLLLEVSHLLFHLSLITYNDSLAQEGLEEFSNEIDKNCNELLSEQFYAYYASLRRDIREISLAYRYYNPKRIGARAV